MPAAKKRNLSLLHVVLTWLLLLALPASSLASYGLAPSRTAPATSGAVSTQAETRVWEIFANPGKSAWEKAAQTRINTWENREIGLKTALGGPEGRFWTADSYEGVSEDPGSLHKYLYAVADPVNAMDPSGYDDIGELTVREAVDGQIESAVNQISVKTERQIVKKVAIGIIKDQVVSGVYTFILESAGGGIVGIYTGQSGNIAVRIAQWEARLNKEGNVVRLISVLEVQGGAGYRAQKFLREVIELAIKLATRKFPGVPGIGGNQPVDPANFLNRQRNHFGGDPLYNAISAIWDKTIGPILDKL